jgi:hypothetical protein
MTTALVSESWVVCSTKSRFAHSSAWATAWSFDRLRLHVDEGLDPKSAFRFAAIHLCSRLAIAFIWLWQCLVPKLLLNHVDERAMLTASHVPIELLPLISTLEIRHCSCSHHHLAKILVLPMQHLCHACRFRKRGRGFAVLSFRGI